MVLTKTELEEIIEKLEKIKGRHTELITVYIPKDYDINSVQKQLEAERSTAQNIKSAGTRKNVMDALDKIVRYLKALKKTPENGLAIFAGDISGEEGQSNIELWSVEPPKELNSRLYRCDKEFVLDQLKQMLKAEEVFGLLVMDRKEASIGILEGKKVELLQKMTSGIPSQVRAGGQSAQRFHRITENLTKEFYKRVADELKKIFFNMDKLKGILVGGPVPTKDEFLDGDYLVTKLKDKVIGRVDLGDTSESGLEELVEKSQKILVDQEIIHEKKILEKFFQTLGRNPDMAVYKEELVEKALEQGAVEILILSKDFDKKKSKNLEKKAQNISSEVETVSEETEEGRQFKNLSGVGAILRYKLPEEILKNQ